MYSIHVESSAIAILTPWAEEFEQTFNGFIELFECLSLINTFTFYKWIYNVYYTESL